MDPRERHARRLRQLLVLGGILSLAVVPVARMEAAEGVRITGYAISGSTVEVSLHNGGSASVSGFVVVEALVNGLPALKSAPFAVAPGESTTVSVGFGGVVQEVIQLGDVIDASDPT